MSARPRQVADEASKFTLRNFFAGTDTAVAPEPPVAETPALFLQPTAPRQLSFDLGAAAAARPVAASTGAGLRFTLPAMNTRTSVTAGRPGGGNKMLQAGYITGGVAKNDPEVMRLNGIVDDLQERLKRSTERIGNAEQSVARGNAALQTERATSHARIVALATEVKNAQQRETAVRAELVAVPRLSDMDASKFAMQARGAVELQASYDKEVKRVEELELTMAETTGKHALLVDENVALCAGIETAKAELAAAQELATAATPVDEALKAENETLKARLETAKELATAAVPVDEALKAENETLKAQLETLATTADTELHEKLLSENVELNARLEAATAAQPTADAEHTEALASLGAALEEARQQIVNKEALVTAEKLRCCGADELIKTLDAKLVTMRQEKRCAPTETSAEDVHPAVVADLAQYAWFKQNAEHAAALVRCAGPDASDRMKDDAEFKHAKARRCAHELEDGRCDRSRTTCFETPCQPHTIDLAAVRASLETKLNVNSYRNGVACMTENDCAVDFHEIPVSTGRVAVSARHQAAGVSMQMRTSKYVSAVQDDIKAKLVCDGMRWKDVATGAVRV